MKRTMKFVLPLFFLAVIGMVSCQKDDKIEPISSEEALAVSANVRNEVFATIGNVVETPAFSAIANLSILLDVDLFDKAHQVFPELLSINNLVNPQNIGVESVKMFSTGVKNDDDFLSMFGTFTWNPETGEFDFASNQSNKIVILFPADGNTGNNNAQLTISGYSFLTHSDGYTFPTGLGIELTVNQKVEFSLTYALSVLENLVIKEGVVSATLADLSLDLKLTLNSSSKGLNARVEHSLKKGSVSVTSSNLAVVMPGLSEIVLFDEFEDIDEDTGFIPSTIQGFLQIAGVKMDLEITPLKFMNALFTPNYEPSANDEQIYADNFNVQFLLYPENEHFGDLVFRWVPEQNNAIPFIRFKDKKEVELFEAFGLSNQDLEIFEDLL